MDKRLFTPGPLMTSASVKAAMLRDLGSRDAEFIGIVRDVRQRLLGLGGVSQKAGFEAILLQGAGTFGIESVIGSALAVDGELLVVINGAYGERMERIATMLGIKTHAIVTPELQTPRPEAVARELERHPGITHVAVVHCETTTGILNPVEEIGAVVRAAGKRYVVDSMSAFGSVPIDLHTAEVDFLVSSSNKCIEGVPGFSVVLCRNEALLESEGRARSLSLDLVAQWRGLERDGQFRFTPPTHAILAFRQALEELEDEGGVVARGARYRENQRTLSRGMHALGFEELVPRADQGNIISTFRYLDHPRFDFDELYERLSERGFVIYPGKLSQCDSFRIGTCGRIDAGDIRELLSALRSTLSELGITPLPVSP